MRSLMRPFGAALLMAAWHPAVPVANAQPPSLAPGLSDQAPNISDQKLDAAAAALKEVASVKDNYQERLQAAPASDLERIVDEAHSAIVKAVTNQGLSVEEYTSIIVVARNDPQVRDRLLQRIRSLAK